MRRIVILAALLLCPRGVSAGILEFDLPDVLGHYDVNLTSRLDTLTYAGSEIVAVAGISVVLDGGAVTGLIECPDSWSMPDTLAWGMSVGTYVRRSGSASDWYGWANIDQDGDFAAFPLELGHAGFDRLYPGDRIVVEQLYFWQGFVDLCVPLTPYPTGDITAATLRIVTEPALAVEQSTWGRIKALYR